jgi:hypothetical protein
MKLKKKQLAHILKVEDWSLKEKKVQNVVLTGISQTGCTYYTRYQNIVTQRLYKKNQKEIYPKTKNLLAY